MRVLALTAALLLAACAQQPAPAPVYRPPTPTATKPVIPPATQAEKDKWAQAYLGCLMVKAKELDDKKSDAATIGRAIARECDPTLRRLVEISSPDLSPGERARVFEALRTEAPDRATAIVLQIRTGKLKV